MAYWIVVYKVVAKNIKTNRYNNNINDDNNNNYDKKKL